MNMAILDLLAQIVAIIVGGIVGFHVHERTHYLLGRIWTKDLWLEGPHRILPDVLMYGSPESLPPHGIRIAGSAPLIYMPFLPVSLVNWLSGMTVVSGFIFVVILVASFPSPSDLLAVFRPERWKRMAVHSPDNSHAENLKLLVGMSKVKK